MRLMIPMLVVLIVLAGLALFYLVTRFHRFTCLKAMRNRALSWLLAVLPVAAVACFAFINIPTMVVVFLHLIIIWLLCDLVIFAVVRIRKKPFRRYYQGIAALVITLVYLGAGWFFAHHIFQTDYAFTTEKDLGTQSVRIVEIADAHLGVTLDRENFPELISRIQNTDPDLVVIVGDFVDDDSGREDMLAACRALGKLDTTYGVYFVFGNHDEGYFRYRDFTAQELRTALAQNSVTVLEDESVLIGDSFYLIGRKDRSSRDRADAQTLVSGLDRSKYMILLDHQPNDYAAEAEAGVDLVLSGHTHGGHIFPAGLIGEATGTNDKTYGTQRRGNTTFVVTSGVSGWAIPFKTGTISEFVVIDIITGQQQS